MDRFTNPVITELRESIDSSAHIKERESTSRRQPGVYKTITVN